MWRTGPGLSDGRARIELEMTGSGGERAEADPREAKGEAVEKEAHGQGGGEGRGAQAGAEGAEGEAPAHHPDGAPAQALVKLATVSADYQWYSSQASSAVRYLAVAGVGLVWLLAGGSIDGMGTLHLCALLLLAGVMGADLLQYTVAARVWGRFLDEQAARGRGPESLVALDLGQTTWIDRAYRTKLVLLLCAWAMVLWLAVRQAAG
jgi:hypothetical protein